MWTFFPRERHPRTSNNTSQSCAPAVELVSRLNQYLVKTELAAVAYKEGVFSHSLKRFRRKFELACGSVLMLYFEGRQFSYVTGHQWAAVSPLPPSVAPTTLFSGTPTPAHYGCCCFCRCRRRCCCCCCCCCCPTSPTKDGAIFLDSREKVSCYHRLPSLLPTCLLDYLARSPRPDWSDVP